MLLKYIICHVYIYHVYFATHKNITSYQSLVLVLLNALPHGLVLVRSGDILSSKGEGSLVWTQEGLFYAYFNTVLNFKGRLKYL